MPIAYVLRNSTAKLIARILSLLLIVLLASCGSSEPDSKSVPPTATPITAKVPDTSAETPTAALPQPTLPPALADDMALIKRAIRNTSVAAVDRLHFVDSSTSSFWGTLSTIEGDYVPLTDLYQRETRNGLVKETLELNNKYYCKDNTGNWIVVVEDVNAKMAEGLATVEAQLNEEWEEKGYPDTPPTMSIPLPIPDKSQFPEQLPMLGTLSLEGYDFGYAGEQMVDGTLTRHYLGTNNRDRKLPMPPDADTDTGDKGAEVPGSDSPSREEMIEFWIDPVKEQIRQIEQTHSFVGKQTVGATNVMDFSSCGNTFPTPTTPQSNPTQPSISGEATVIVKTTLTYSKINDPSVVLPTP